jgi:polar amino acid transport system substrate-binding protein
MNVKLLIILYCLSCFAQAQTKFQIRVVATENKLMQYQENGINKGSTIDILNVLLKENNIETTVEYMPWARAYKIAETTPNTIILSMVRTPERENKFEWIGVVSQLSRVFISLKNRPENFVINKEQAKKKIVAVERNALSHIELLKQGFTVDKNLYIVSSIKQAFKLLIKGKVDLIYHDPVVIEDYIDKESQSNEKITYAPVIPQNQRMSYIAINKNSNVKLVKKLKLSMDKFSKTERYKELINQ